MNAKPSVEPCAMVCNEKQIMPLMIWYVEKEGMSQRAASRQVSDDYRAVGGIVTPQRAMRVYQNRKGGDPCGSDVPDEEIESRFYLELQHAISKKPGEYTGRCGRVILEAYAGKALPVKGWADKHETMALIIIETGLLALPEQLRNSGRVDRLKEFMSGVFVDQGEPKVPTTCTDLSAMAVIIELGCRRLSDRLKANPVCFQARVFLSNLIYHAVDFESCITEDNRVPEKPTPEYFEEVHNRLSAKYAELDAAMPGYLSKFLKEAEAS